MVKRKRKGKKSVVRKTKIAARKVKPGRTAARKTKRSYDIPTGQPTGREVQTMHRLQVLIERRRAPERNCELIHAKIEARANVFQN